MNIILKIPVCNIISCEDIAVNGDDKIYICNPFTGTAERNIRKFYTYTVIQGIPNNSTIFKIQIAGPKGNIIKETEESKVAVEDNIIRAKTRWNNISFSDSGEHTINVLIKFNNEFEIVGTSHIYVV